jgi:NAD(P)H-quinone oxidoreductase subunit I
MVTSLRELAYLPKGVLNPHGVADDAHRGYYHLRF